MFEDKIGQFLKLRNIFGPSGVGTPTFTGEPIMPEEEDFPMPEFSTKAQDMYQGQLEAFPERNNPGLLRKLAAIGASFNSPEAVERSLYAPYIRELGDWKEKIEPMGRLATMENQANTQNRLIWQTQENNRIRDKQEERRAREGEGKLDIANKKLALEQIRTELARNAGSKIVVDRDGHQYLVYPDSRRIDLGIDTLSFEDRLELEKAGKLDIIAATGAQDMSEIQARHANELKEIQRRHDLELEELKKRKELGLGGNDSTVNENNIKQGKINRAYELIRNRPEYKDFIKFDPNSGQPLVEVPIAGLFKGGVKDAKEATRITEEINKYIDPDYKGGAGTISTAETKVGSGTTKPAPSSLSNPGTVNPDSVYRQRAVNFLKEKKLVINEQTIKTIVERLKKAEAGRK